MATNGAATNNLQDKHSFLHQTRFPGDLVLAAGPKVYAPGPPTNAHEALTNDATGFFAERLPGARRGWPLKEAAPWRGHLVAVSLEGAALNKDMQAKRTAAVLRVADVTSPHDGFGPELVLYVRLQRPVAAKHGLKACTPEDVPYFRLSNAEARRLLCNLKIAAFDTTTAHNGRNQHHPYVMSILVSMHALGDLTTPCLGETDALNQPVLKAGGGPSAFANGDLTVVCLPPLSQELEKCFALLGHSLAVGTVATAATKGDDGESDGGSTASDEVPIANKLDSVWGHLHAKTTEVGNQFRSCTQSLFDLFANRPRQEAAAVLTDTIPNLSARSSAVGACILQETLAHLVGTAAAATAAPKAPGGKKAPNGGGAKPKAATKAASTKPSTSKPAPKPVPKSKPAAAPAAAPSSKPVPEKAPAKAPPAPRGDDGGSDSDSWDMSQPAESECGGDDALGQNEHDEDEQPKSKRRKLKVSKDGNEGDLDAMNDDDLSDADLDSEEDSYESGEEEDFVAEDSEPDEEPRVRAPAAERPVQPPPPEKQQQVATMVAAAPAARALPAPAQYTPLLRELERLLEPSASLLGWVAAPLGDKVTALKTAIHDWERKDHAPSPDAFLAPIVVDLVHALHALAERRDAAGAVAMPAEEAARVRGLARDAHALGSATLPLVGEAISDVRALEARLVQLQRRGAEVLEEVGRGLPRAAPAP